MASSVDPCLAHTEALKPSSRRSSFSRSFHCYWAPLPVRQGSIAAHDEMLWQHEMRWRFHTQKIPLTEAPNLLAARRALDGDRQGEWKRARVRVK